MSQSGEGRIETIVRTLAANRAVMFTTRAHQEMVEEDITAAELLTSLVNCVLLEDYPDHKRGACCLVCGKAVTGSYLHIVLHI